MGETMRGQDINEKFVKRFGKSWMSHNETTLRKIEIEDIPILLTQDGTTVCIPKRQEQAVTAIIGHSGFGKTSVAGYILDELFWSWKDYVVNMNDSQEESFDWSEPCDWSEFVGQIRKIRQDPMPLPMIYLFPKMYLASEHLLEDKNFVTISVPFREVMNNIEKFIPDLGASEKYLLEKKKELLPEDEDGTGMEITEEEIFDIIKSIDNGEKGMKQVVAKIRAAFRELIDEGILNLDSASAPAYLQVGDYIGNPFTAIMLAQCIPSFVTSSVYNQKYKDQIFSYYLSCLFNESLKGKMKGKRVWVYFDELTRVVSADQRSGTPETEKQLNNYCARGRNNGISLMYATQRYKEIPKGIRELTKNGIIFRHKSKEETSEICDDFGLDKTWREEILSLKKFQAIAVSADQPFICYKGERKWKDGGPIKGWIIPALHKNRFLQKEKKK